MSSYTYCRTSYVGWISSVIRVITPRAPSPTTAPWKTSPSALRDSFTTSPAAVTISMPETAVARLPFFSPEPCVAVLHAPAMEMWGSEARLCSAKPLLSRYGQSWPYVMPASTVTVRATGSSATTSCIGFRSDVGERSQVVQRKTLAVEVWAELAIRDAGIDGHCAGDGVERHHLVHRFQRQQVVAAVRNGVETVARAEHLHFLLRPENGLDLLD